ncbi:transcription termination factor NusA [Kordiimonas pumila]|uniref:Transcription termination/antitermination protein NusA n=1 Tax=Kordiimonas pumila TaxID=2161677 RepID=A0ABV7D142_9PROT|nr:transcription termination factor NusA [Kordiimonas pumila]
MASAISANRLELLQIADLVAREKSIEKEIVLEAMEEAIQKAARSKYGAENEIRAQIDKNTGDIRLFRVLEVVEAVEEPATQISVQDAQKNKPDAVIGDFLASSLPPMDFGRIAAQTAKQVIVQKVRDAERERQYEEYKDRVGEIVTGLVKRVEYGNVIVDLGKSEAIMRRDQVIPREHIRQNERIRGFIYEVRRENRGPQIFMSRTKPDFMGALFAQEVPEIYDGIIEIRSVARDPGSRAKIAVISNDTSIDPVGACVGMRGSRVQAVVNELQGEKIDIIPWSPDVASFIVNALQPAEVAKVVMDEDRSRVEVVVPDDQLSLAIGRRGQNVRLASQLTGWTIDIMTEAEESERRQEEFMAQSKRFVEALDVDDTLAHLLVAEGFTDLEEIAFVEPEELLAVEGFEEELVEELQRRANDFLEAEAKAADKKRKEIGVDDALADIEGLTPQMLVALGEAEVKTLEDFAGCAADELTSKDDGILKAFSLTEEDASNMIMSTRVVLGWISAEDLLGKEEEAEEAAEEAVESEAETSENVPAE